MIDEDKGAYGFTFVYDDQRIRMNPTLEDVLFLTELFIVGKPVNPNDNQDLQAFNPWNDD